MSTPKDERVTDAIFECVKACNARVTDELPPSGSEQWDDAARALILREFMSGWNLALDALLKYDGALTPQQLSRCLVVVGKALGMKLARPEVSGLPTLLVALRDVQRHDERGLAASVKFFCRSASRCECGGTAWNHVEFFTGFVGTVQGVGNVSFEEGVLTVDGHKVHFVRDYHANPLAMRFFNEGGEPVGQILLRQ